MREIGSGIQSQLILVWCEARRDACNWLSLHSRRNVAMQLLPIQKCWEMSLTLFQRLKLSSQTLSVILNILFAQGCCSRRNWWLYPEATSSWGKSPNKFGEGWVLSDSSLRNFDLPLLIFCLHYNPVSVALQFSQKKQWRCKLCHGGKVGGLSYALKGIIVLSSRKMFVFNVCHSW